MKKIFLALILLCSVFMLDDAVANAATISKSNGDIFSAPALVDNGKKIRLNVKSASVKFIRHTKMTDSFDGKAVAVAQFSYSNKLKGVAYNCPGYYITRAYSDSAGKKLIGYVYIYVKPGEIKAHAGCEQITAASTPKQPTKALNVVHPIANAQETSKTIPLTQSVTPTAPIEKPLERANTDVYITPVTPVDMSDWTKTLTEKESCDVKARYGDYVYIKDKSGDYGSTSKKYTCVLMSDCMYTDVHWYCDSAKVENFSMDAEPQPIETPQAAEYTRYSESEFYCEDDENYADTDCNSLMRLTDTELPFSDVEYEQDEDEPDEQKEEEEGEAEYFFASCEVEESDFNYSTIASAYKIYQLRFYTVTPTSIDYVPVDKSELTVSRGELEAINSYIMVRKDISDFHFTYDTANQSYGIDSKYISESNVCNRQIDNDEEDPDPGTGTGTNPDPGPPPPPPDPPELPECYCEELAQFNPDLGFMCCVFDCPAWDDYLGFISSEIDRAIGDINTPQVPTDLGTPLHPAVDLPTLDAPTSKESPDLGANTFNDDDIKAGADEIQFRPDASDGFDIVNPLDTLDDMHKDAPMPNLETLQHPMPTQQPTDDDAEPTEPSNFAKYPVYGGTSGQAPQPNTNDFAPYPQTKTEIPNMMQERPAEQKKMDERKVNVKY